MNQLSISLFLKDMFSRFASLFKQKKNKEILENKNF